MSGTVAPQYLYLTTRGWRSGEPRETEIWFTTRQGRFHLIAEHGERAHWVRNLTVEPRVRWRVAGQSFSGRARVVRPEAEPLLCQAVQAASTAKYGWGDGLVVELTSHGDASEAHGDGSDRAPRDGELTDSEHLL